MTSFLGTHRHTVDAKGRLSIPSKFRKATGDVFVVTRGLDGCLFLYPKEEWDLIAQKVRSLEWTEDDPRFFAREFAAYAHEMTVDSHGRVMLPQELRELVYIGIDVLVIGAFERIELWDPDVYKAYRSGYAHSFEQASARLYGKERPAEVDGRRPQKSKRTAKAKSAPRTRRTAKTKVRKKR